MTSENPSVHDTGLTPITLMLPYEVKDLAMVDHESFDPDMNDRKRISKLPCFDGKEPRVLLYCFRRIKVIGRNKNCQDTDWWEAWDSMMIDSAESVWAEICRAIPDGAVEDFDEFEDRVNLMIVKCFPQGGRSAATTCLNGCTDHKNPTCATMNSQRALRWRLCIEEHGHCVKGEKNVSADAFSRAPTEHSELLQHRLNLPQTTKDGFFSLLDDPEMMECFLNCPGLDVESPLDFHSIRHEQTVDQQLTLLHQQHPFQFQLQTIDGCDLACHQSNPQDRWRIVIPTSVLQSTAKCRQQDSIEIW